MSKDLGTIGQPIGNLFPQPATPAAWAQHALNAEQVRHYREFGYVKPVRVFDDRQVDALLQEFDRVVHPDNPGNEFFYEYNSNESASPNLVLFHALGAWRVMPNLHDVLWCPAFRMPAYQLLGTPYRLFHDQLFCKPAGHGGVVNWHQDYSYWTWTTPMSHLTCWIALDDVTIENGCMYFVPKSHTWGLLPRTALSGNMDTVRDLLSPDQNRAFDSRVPVELKRGEASFHHPLLMHGSYENRSQRPRRATLINVFSDGVISNREDNSPNAPGADNYPRVPKGAKMGGTYYPLLFDPVRELGPGHAVPTMDVV